MVVALSLLNSNQPKSNLLDSKVKTQLHWVVPGHAVIPKNGVADQEAKKAAQSQIDFCLSLKKFTVL